MTDIELPDDAQVVALAPDDLLTQEDVDAALVEAEEKALHKVPLGAVRDIPGVKTVAHSDNIEEWRRIRTTGGTLSATAATTVMGTNPFATIMDLWRERMEGRKPTFSAFSMRIMNYGTLVEPELLEEANRWLVGQERDEEFCLTHGYVVAADDERFGCTPDGWRLVDEGPGGTGHGHLTLELLELKTGSKSWRKTPRSKPVVPRNYQDQVQWQLMVTRAHRALVVYRQVRRDKQGNVVEVLGHEFVWVERDEKRIGQMIEAVNEYLRDEAELRPPMVHIDLEDQFDDAVEVTREKAAIREALADIRRADDAIATVQGFIDARKAAADRLKAILAARKGRQVLTSDGLSGATLSRSTRTGYDASLLTEKQRERIRTTTTIESLRVSAERGE